MRILMVSAALVAVATLGACSKPSDPSNPAVATEQNQAKAEPTSGDNSFTEAQAKGHIENAGYTDVTALTQDDKGVWNGTAMKDGKSVAVSVDYQGGVTTR
jgi:hypothetical protein